MPRVTDVEDIYDRVQEDIKIEDLTQKGIADWLASGTDRASPSGSQLKVGKDIESIAVDFNEDQIRELFDKGNLEGFKKKEFALENLNTQKENIAFNLSMTLMRDLRDANNLEGLQDLKGDVQGLRDESELIETINKTLERLE